MVQFLDYQCQLDLNQINDPYLALTPYRQLLALYLVGNKAIIGNKIYINVRYSNGQYYMNLNYYVTKLEPIILNNSKPYYVKFVSLQGAINHSTLLILDLTEFKAYYLDTNGIPDWFPEAFRVIDNYLNSHLKDFKLSLDIDICPIGPQYITHDDFCANWTLLLLYLKVNSDNDINSIINNLISLGTSKLNQIMSNWTCYLWQLVNDLQLEQINFYLSQLQFKMKSDQFNKLETFIVNMLVKHNINIIINTLKYEIARS